VVRNGGLSDESPRHLDVRVWASRLAREHPAIDDVAWSAVKHSYGSAQDVPALLHQLTDCDDKTAYAALLTLANLVRHQGGTSAS
jgi:hypothetical protein